jgi:hypothetical protein
MNRRSGQKGTIVIQSGWYRVRWRMDRRSGKRVNMTAKVAPVVFDKERKPKEPSPKVCPSQLAHFKGAVHRPAGRLSCPAARNTDRSDAPQGPSNFLFFLWTHGMNEIVGSSKGFTRARDGPVADLKSTRPITEPIRTYATDNCILLLGLCGHGLSLPGLLRQSDHQRSLFLWLRTISTVGPQTA